MLLLKIRSIVGPEQLTSISGSSYVLTLMKVVDLREPVIGRISSVMIISFWLHLDRQIIVIILKLTTENMLINTKI